MIRLFAFLYKLDFKQLPSTVSLFRAIDKGFRLHSAHCPKCKAKGRLNYHDSYGRDLVAYENGSVQENLIAIRRVYCSSCETTSAILPDVIVPHKSYSILFILCVLRAYFFKEMPVAALCSHYGIGVATLYAWKKQYLFHKMLDLGKLEKYLFERDPHLLRPLDVFLSSFLHSFFQRFGFSFLQHSLATVSDSS